MNDATPTTGWRDHWCLYEWCETSSVHAYPVHLFWGTRAECEARRLASNFPSSLRVDHEWQLPGAY